MVQTSQAGAPTVAEMPPIENRTRAGTPAATKTTCFQSTSRNIVGLVEAATAIYYPPLRAAPPRRSILWPAGAALAQPRVEAHIKSMAPAGGGIYTPNSLWAGGRVQGVQKSLKIAAFLST